MCSSSAAVEVCHSYCCVHALLVAVDNARHFGRIAAANAISDVYAMGGKPLMALSVLGMPINKLPTEVIQAGT